MSALIDVRHFRLEKSGGELSLTLRPGQMLGVFGRSGSGKTAFLRAIAGLEKPRHGSVRLAGAAWLAGYSALPRRAQSDSLARRFAARGGATRAAEALAAVGLWADRKKAISSLGAGQLAAAELLEGLAGLDPILLIDGQLDRIDPWARVSSRELLERRLREGAAVVIATNEARWLSQCDLAVIFRDRVPAFAGTPAELERRHGQVRMEVETLRGKAVRALCDPFEITVAESPSGLQIVAKDGQEIAAKLLLEGYGDVRAIVARPPRPEELIEAL